MSIKLSTIASDFNIELKRLKELISEGDFDIKPGKKVVDEDLADKIRVFLESLELDELKAKKELKGRAKIEVAEKIKEGIPIPSVIRVKDLADQINCTIPQVIGCLMKNGLMLNLNASIDFDTAAIVADDLNVQIYEEKKEEDFLQSSLTSLLEKDNEKSAKLRPPVISVMGHVDHGKTSLLDAIRETSVAGGEAGGITQRIGAYQVVYKKQPITFIDTPGHEAFALMRARGAKATDIAILVVAADDSVQPQTIESIQHVKEAGIPMVVAINKIDTPGANVEKVKKELADHDVLIEEWGGDVSCVAVSAKTKEGLDKLLDTLLLVAEIQEIKADFGRNAVGVVIESHLDKKLGPVATILIKTGTLYKHNDFLIGEIHGRIRLMKNFLGQEIDSAPPSTPVLITGLSVVPAVGDILSAVSSAKTARMESEKIANERSRRELARISLAQSSAQVKEGKIKELKIVVKADSHGTLEALTNSLNKINSASARLKIVRSGVGNVTSSDVMISVAAKAPIIAFTVKSDNSVRSLADREGVEILNFDVIYKVIEELTKALSGMIEPEAVEEILGHGEVLKVFFKHGNEMIIGLKVNDGVLKNKAKLRITRDDEMIGEGLIVSLKKGEETVKEIATGFECGMKYQGAVKLKAGDKLEAYVVEMKILDEVSSK